jgi:hypothetical protein
VKEQILALFCNTEFRKSNSVLRFIKDEGYADNFGYEWLIHSSFTSPTMKLHRQSKHFKLGLNHDTVKDKLILRIRLRHGLALPASCKHGMQNISWQSTMSQAIDVTVQNTKMQPNTTYMQADLMNLPLGEGAFDIYTGLGVLHHTPSTKKHFRQSRGT